LRVQGLAATSGIDAIGLAQAHGDGGTKRNINGVVRPARPVIAFVAIRSRRCRRTGHRFRRTHRSALAKIEQAPAPPFAG
jgi:hypothetical protein